MESDPNNFIVLCFVNPIFCVWSLLAMKLRKLRNITYLCLHFARQDGQDGKKRKENHATKVTKIPKAKTYEMNKTLEIKKRKENSRLKAENLQTF